MTRRTATLLAVALVCTALASAQDRRERGKQIVDQAIQALGGEAFLNMQDRVEGGRLYAFYREQLSGLAKAVVYSRYVTAPRSPEPGKVYVRERTSYGATADDPKEDYANFFDETSGYTITFRGARPFPDDEIERYQHSRRMNVFYILRQRLNEPGMIVEYSGAEIFENKPVEKVTFTDTENNSLEVMFNRSTKLPVRQVFYRRDPFTKLKTEEVTQYDKYLDVGGGVMWPYHVVRKRDGDRIFEMFSDVVRVNQKLTDDLFTLPVDMKVLPLAK